MKCGLLVGLTAGMTALERTLFEECRIEEAMLMEPETAEDCTMKFFLEHRFGSDCRNALRYMAERAAEEPVQILLMRVADSRGAKRNTRGPLHFRMSEPDLVALLQAHAKKITSAYLANHYDFFEVPRLASDMPSDEQHAIVNIWTMNAQIITKFFSLIAQNRIRLADVKTELLFLTRNKVPKAFGLVGDIYLYGLGETADSEKAMDYYVAGQRLGDTHSILGIAKILAQPVYNDREGMLKMLGTLPFIEANHEAQYLMYRALQADSSHVVITSGQPNTAWAYLRNSAIGGYLPAVYEYAVVGYKAQPGSSMLKSLRSVTNYSPFLLNIATRAYDAYRSGALQKATLYYLYLAEFNIRAALPNALYILMSQRLFNAQDALQAGILRDLSRRNPRYAKELGDCYYYGRGVTQSYEAALAYYYIGSAVVPECTYNISYMFEQGLGVPRSFTAAQLYLNTPHLKRSNTYLLLFYARLRIIIKRIIFAFSRSLLCYVYTALALSCTVYAIRRTFIKINS